MRCSASNCPTLHLSASAFPVISGLLAAGCWRSGTGLTTGHLTLEETLLHLQLQVTSASVVTAVTRGHVRVRVGLGGRLLRHPAGPPLRHPQGAAAGPQPDQRARHPPELRAAGASLSTQPRLICTLHPAGGAAVAAAGALLPALLGGRHQLPLLRRVHAGPRADTGRQAQARCRTYRGRS